MKLSSILCASACAFALTVGSFDAASAATNLNSSRSNIYKINPNDPNAEKACTDGGGKVSTDKDGQKICTKPEPANASNLNSSKSN